MTGIFKTKDPAEIATVKMTTGAVTRAIDAGELPARVTEVQQFRRVGVRRVRMDDDTDYRPLVPSFKSKHFSIARADLLAWCESRGIYPPLLFPDAPTPASPVDAGELSDYHTPALDALRAAIRHFWLKHDPQHPPKSPEIIDWLTREHGITPTMAKAIDRVIRPESQRRGGNIKVS